MPLAHAADNIVIEPSPSLLREGVAALRAHVRHPAKEVRWLAIFGWLLVLSGLAHVVVWLLKGAPPLDGPVGWRKPIVFGVSGGVTTLSLAALKVGAPSAPRWTALYAVTMGLEIALIDVQAWRGVASHFNASTALDGAIFSLMGVLILVSMTAAGVLAVRATRAQREEDVKRASGLATVALLVGTAVGIAMAVHGSTVQQLGGTPSRIGAGEWKPVHALALHGLQLFPMAAWWLRRRSPVSRDRARALSGLGLSWALVVTAAFVQLLLGRAPADPAVVPLLLAGAGVAVAGASVAPFLRARATP